VALERLDYPSGSATLTYQSDKARGPTAGRETVEVLEFLARVVSHMDPVNVLSGGRVPWARVWGETAY
jgi:hypothetical protein